MGNIKYDANVEHRQAIVIIRSVKRYLLVLSNTIPVIIVETTPATMKHAPSTAITESFSMNGLSKGLITVAREM